ncbi:hypothetical protein K3495_g14881 [Podosphaera aphanis]|nr:hypothetical protein K3495_g14881 [Podosphaera aphanis]
MTTFMLNSKRSKTRTDAEGLSAFIAKLMDWRERNTLPIAKEKQTRVRDLFKFDETDEECIAVALFTFTVGFSQLDTPEWKRFFKRLGFELPNRQKSSTTLLNNAYNSVKVKVQAVADSLKYIQIVSDGSSNIFKHRVENISFLVNGISYYWRSTAIGATRAGTEWTTNHVISAATEITRGDLRRWTAFSSDTCSTQRNVWETMPSTQINGNMPLKHLHSIPCDSHAHQIIFKDLLWPGQGRDSITTQCGQFWKEGPNVLVSFFSSSHKQLSIVREIMLVTQGKVNSFIATVPTCWGTQVRQIFSILRAQVPRKSYTRHPKASEKWSAILRDSDCWQNLRALYRISEPVHSSQMMSESNRASLAKVCPRWLKIDSHFRQNQLPHSGPRWYDL